MAPVVELARVVVAGLNIEVIPNASDARGVDVSIAGGASGLPHLVQANSSAICMALQMLGEGLGGFAITVYAA